MSHNFGGPDTPKTSGDAPYPEWIVLQIQRSVVWKGIQGMWWGHWVQSACRPDKMTRLLPEWISVDNILHMQDGHISIRALHRHCRNENKKHCEPFLNTNNVTESNHIVPNESKKPR